MLRNKSFGLVLLALVFAGGFVAGNLTESPGAARAQEHDHGEHVFELRTYTASPGKLSDLEARFRNHTVGLFEKHGMTNVGYWVPTDEPLCREHADLRPRAREPRRRAGELGRLPRGSGVGGGAGRVGAERPPGRQRRGGLHEGDRLFAHQLEPGANPSAAPPGARRAADPLAPPLRT